MLPNTLTERKQSPQTAFHDRKMPHLREMPADLETPVSVYLKLAGYGPSFLLESVTGGEQVARYSFIGVQPSRAYALYGRELHVTRLDEVRQTEIHRLPDEQIPLMALRQMLAGQHYSPVHGLPRFTGGLVGYLGYEAIRFFEPSVRLDAHPAFPDALFLQADIIVAFDHAFGKLLLIGNPRPEITDEQLEARLDEIEARLAGPLPLPPDPRPAVPANEQANMTHDEFTAAVRQAKEHIAAGDIFQVVLSQRLTHETSAYPFDIYRTLRRINPSPYMFFFDFDGLTGEQPFHLIGASPEMHVRLEEGMAAIRPIAGTRPRGQSPAEDAKLETELLADPKERAEHVMLVDLARNDLGRICRYGTVKVTEKMEIERYSHVMHIVSHVEGELRPEYDAFDLLCATFPAGTVSGAPKIRAMQIISQLEKDPRGPYAGAVGYFSYDGSLDTCITIRTLLLHGSTLHMQAGAGIVADSDPETEYQETLNKLRALAVAVERTESKP
jgi:anthranilate synthase component 1